MFSRRLARLLVLELVLGALPAWAQAAPFLAPPPDASSSRVWVRGGGAGLVHKDLNGNRTKQVETNGHPAPTTEETTYSYDALNRLASVNYPDKKVGYGYDLVGNRTSEVERNLAEEVLSNKLANFDAVNRVTSIADSVVAANNAAFTWDENSNQLTKTTGGTTTEYRYDTRDNLVEIGQAAAILGRFQFDFEGRRNKKIGEEGIRQFVYDDTSLLTEYDSSGAPKAKYDYGSDRLISLFRQDEGRRYFHLDGLGSVVNLTDDTGSAQASYHLDAWGGFRLPAELDASKNRFGLTGHYFDRETGLYYAKSRFYDPKIGRFITQDSFLGSPDQPPSLHRFAYANANPLRYVDPDGHFTQLLQAWQSVDQLNKLADVVETQAAKSNPAGGNSGTWWGQALNFAEHYKSKVVVALMRLPGQARETGLNVLTPGGAEAVRTGRPEPNRGPYADLQAEALRGAADPENSLGLRASFATTAAMSQPAVALEQGVLKPVEHGIGHSEKIAVHAIQAQDNLRSGDVVGATIQAAEAANESLQAFNAFASPILAGEGIRVTSAKIGPLGPPSRGTTVTPWGTRDIATGKFTTGPRAGLNPVDDFIAQAKAEGYEVLGKEISVKTPFETRRVDVVLRDPRTGKTGGVEIKSSAEEFAKFKPEQFAADKYINRFGAKAVGENARQAGVSEIDHMMKIQWPPPQ